MSFKKPSRKEMLSACDDVGPGDGTDPRYDFRSPADKARNRKALQLCGQASEALNLALASCGDDVLRDLFIRSVVPAPNSGRLLVTVERSPSSAEVGDAEVLARLQAAAGLLRREVAAAINRRRAPELTFRVAE